MEKHPRPLTEPAHRGGIVLAFDGRESSAGWKAISSRRRNHCRMKTSPHVNKIERYQNLGFLVILLPCCFDVLRQIPQPASADHPWAFQYCRSTLDLLLVLAIWLLVNRSTRRILARMQYLEKFMRVCAWCRRIDYHGEWMPLEEFMRQSFDTPTTHGICKECLAQQQAAIEHAKQTRWTEKPAP
jgi:hypothetical protein